MFNPIQTFLSSVVGKVAAALGVVVIILAVLLYVGHAHYTAELSTKDVTISRKDAQITDIQGKLDRSQKDLKDTIAINNINNDSIQELQAQIATNTKICTSQVTKLKNDLSKVKNIHDDLHNYGASNPDSFLNYRIPDEAIDAANGKGKSK